MTRADISPLFKYNPRDARIVSELLQHQGTPRAITYFAEVCDQLTDYAYWFNLGTLWVNYSGWSDLQLWKRLLSSRRPNRVMCLLKPSERMALKVLPEELTVYRAHREGETDWIAYTLNPVTAGRFARERGVDSVTQYKVRKREVTALFLRRGEEEIIVLDRWRVKRQRILPVVPVGGGGADAPAHPG